MLTDTAIKKIIYSPKAKKIINSFDEQTIIDVITEHPIAINKISDKNITPKIIDAAIEVCIANVNKITSYYYFPLNKFSKHLSDEQRKSIIKLSPYSINDISPTKEDIDYIYENNLKCTIYTHNISKEIIDYVVNKVPQLISTYYYSFTAEQQIKIISARSSHDVSGFKNILPETIDYCIDNNIYSIARHVSDIDSVKKIIDTKNKNFIGNLRTWRISEEIKKYIFSKYPSVVYNTITKKELVSSYIDVLDPMKYSEYIKDCPALIRYIDQTEELCILAVQSDSSVFKYIKNPTENIIDCLLDINPLNIAYLKKPTDDQKIKALRADPRSIKSIKNVKQSILRDLLDDHIELGYYITDKRILSTMIDYALEDINIAFLCYNHLTDNEKMVIRLKYPDIKVR